MNSRRVATIVMLASLILALVLPIFILSNKGSDVAKDPAYQQLDMLGRSLSGDHTADSEAAQALNTATRVMVGSQERYRLSSTKDKCWELSISTSPHPYRVRC